MDHLWCPRRLDREHDHGHERQMGALARIVVGIVGAIIGGFLMTHVFGAPGVTGFDITSLTISVIGAVRRT